MIHYAVHAFVASLRQARILFVLALFGVALGVASVVSVQVVNSNAVGAFVGSVRALSGDADLSVLGVTSTLPEELYPRVLATRGVADAWPLELIRVVLADDPTFVLDAVGIDVFAPHAFPVEIVSGDLSEALFQPGWVAISPVLARERDWVVGSSIRVASGSRVCTLRVGSLVDFQRVTPLASPRLALMDLAQAQSLFGCEGRLSQIDVVAAPGVDPALLAERLAARLGPEARVTTPKAREVEAKDLLAAFRLNLTALSLISVFVGGFLVFTVSRAALVRRRREFGVLRSLGATRAQVFGLMMGEAAVLGTLGAALGIPAGALAARTQLDRVNATLTNIYLLQEVHAAHVPHALIAAAAVLGVASALLAAVGPAIDMSRRDTRALLSAFTLHERAGERAARLAAMGVALIGAALLWQALFGRGVRVAGFVVAFAVLGAIPLCTPALLLAVCGRVRLRSLDLTFSLRNVVRRLATTSVAVAALAAAVSMLFGITIMVSSFRGTLATWLENALRADVYVSPAAWTRGGETAVLAPEVVEELRRHPGVRAVDELRQVLVQAGKTRVTLGGVRFGLPLLEKTLPMLEGDAREAERALRAGGVVLVSEPLARKRGLGLGDTLVVPTPAGTAALPIAGVFYDYVSETGSALMSLETLERYFGPGPVQNVALYTAPGASAQELADAIGQSFAGLLLDVRSNRDLRARTMRVFDETFAITRVLETMALAVAITGVALTLIVLARERVAELALLRALGATSHQVLVLFLGEGAVQGLLGIALGSVGGVAFALLLIYEINRAYFGWTIQLDWPLGAIASQALAVFAATLLAALYPAILASRTRAGELNREDV